MFYRTNKDGNAVIFNEDGTSVERMDADVYPVDSSLGVRYEHSDGIVLTVEDAEELGITEEFGGLE